MSGAYKRYHHPVASYRSTRAAGVTFTRHHRANKAAPQQSRKSTCAKALAASSRAADHYTVLGIPKTADKPQIKAAYRLKARQLHPDVNPVPGAEEAFKAVSTAYEVLSDDKRRTLYDRFGDAGVRGPNAASPRSREQARQNGTNPYDVFEEMFGGGFSNFGGGVGGMGRAGTATVNQTSARLRPLQGEDTRLSIQLDFMEAVFGCNKVLEVSSLQRCTACTGSGLKAGTSPARCRHCSGTGQVVQPVITQTGVFQQVMTCAECDGTGQTHMPCPVCTGSGRAAVSKRISVRVPCGVAAKARLRVKAEGNAGLRGGQVGDLYISIRVRPHPTLLREDTTIRSDVNVSYVDAIVGGVVKTATVDGPVDLRIPAGTQPGTTLLLARRGAPELGKPSARGNHEVYVRVKIPTKLSEEEMQLIQGLRELQLRSEKIIR